jgi:3-hydroxyacyl-CoA dehydrogenase
VSKDSYGFVVNRVLVPMIDEAITCVYEGLATPKDVDQMMKLGANHPMGPVALADIHAAAAGRRLHLTGQADVAVIERRARSETERGDALALVNTQ